jgi:p24 family protein gamma-3
VTGGHYDVDVTLEAPNKEVLYRKVKTQFDSHTFTATVTGVYSACFSNEFSTFSHKLVYMDFTVGDEPALPGVGEHATVITQVCLDFEFRDTLLNIRIYVSDGIFSTGNSQKSEQCS